MFYLPKPKQDSLMTSTDFRTFSTLPATRSESNVLYRNMAILFILSIVIGFSNSIRQRLASGDAGLRTAVMFHGVLFLSWFIIFLVQSLLVAKNRIRLHRRIGYFSVIVASAICLDGPCIALEGVRRGVLGADGIAFMAVMIGDVVGFAVFITLGMICRRKARTHKRFMLLGTLSLLPPAITRWPLISGVQPAVGVVMMAFLAIAPISDLVAKRKVSAVSLWGGLALLASVPLRIGISHTAFWQEFVKGLL
jgi:hypothetical protein